MGEQTISHVEDNTSSGDPEKVSSTVAGHLKEAGPEDQNLVYNVVDEEPEIHVRTYVAIAAMFLLNLVQVFALQGPPAVVSVHMTSILSTSLADSLSCPTSVPACTTLKPKPGFPIHCPLCRRSSAHSYPRLRTPFKHVRLCSSVPRSFHSSVPPSLPAHRASIASLLLKY